MATISFDACIHVEALHPNMIKTYLLVVIYSYIESLVTCDISYASVIFIFVVIYEICLGMLILFVFVIHWLLFILPDDDVCIDIVGVYVL